MRTETKAYLAATDAKFRARTGRTCSDEPHTVTTWAYEPGKGTLMAELTPEQAREWGEILIAEADEAEQATVAATSCHWCGDPLHTVPGPWPDGVSVWVDETEGQGCTDDNGNNRTHSPEIYFA